MPLGDIFFGVAGHHARFKKDHGSWNQLREIETRIALHDRLFCQIISHANQIKVC